MAEDDKPETAPDTAPATEDVFGAIYEKKGWGAGESVSGQGSALSETAHLRAELPKLLKRYGVGSMLDIPCGDFHWMKDVDLGGVDYTGADIVGPLIEANRRFERPGVRFMRLDIVADALPAVELVFARDCLVHLPYDAIGRALRNVAASGAKWLLTTTFPGRAANVNIQTGKWFPLNLEAEPFNLPHPERYLFERYKGAGGRDTDKSLGLWPTDALLG